MRPLFGEGMNGDFTAAIMGREDAWKGRITFKADEKERVQISFSSPQRGCAVNVLPRIGMINVEERRRKHRARDGRGRW